MDDCIFCDIAAGTGRASLAYEDERVVAFMDIQPRNPGHTLVVPRYHAESLAELDVDTGGYLFQVAMRLARALRRSGLPCDAVTLLLSDGEAAGQDVPHVHLHVIPRVYGDAQRGLGAIAPRAALDEAAALIRRALAEGE